LSQKTGESQISSGVVGEISRRTASRFWWELQGGANLQEGTAARKRHSHYELYRLRHASTNANPLKWPLNRISGKTGFIDWTSGTAISPPGAAARVSAT